MARKCLNIAIVGFSNKKAIPHFNKVFKQPIVLPAWGLAVKESSGTRDGKVLRPWRGRLFVDAEGNLRWDRPESIIEL